MNLKPLLSPDSVVIVGASGKKGSLGYYTVDMIKKVGYEGEVYLVNPRYDEILGYKVYPDLESIGKPVDTVVLSLAAKRVEEQVDIAIKNKAKSIIIFANCVTEDDTTPNLEERIMEKCKKANIPVLGHNAMGYYNHDKNLRICGFDAPDEDMKGNIAFISQSGSVFSTFGHNEPQLQFNFMLATGTGNITSLSDFMIYALEQESTKVLGVYMESIRKSDKFIEALELANKKNIPVVVMKVAKSELGSKFAKSHTGGLSSDDDSIQTIFDHYGTIRVESFDELANTLLLFSYYQDIPKGGLVAIADSGGERNFLADESEEINLEYAKLSDKTLNNLQKEQEYGQNAENPLDPWGTGIDFDKIFEKSLKIMIEDNNAAIGIISQDLRDGYFLSEGAVNALGGVRKFTNKPLAFMTNFSGTRRNKLTEKINGFPAPVLVGTRPGLKSIKNFLQFRDFTFTHSEIDELNLSNKSKNLLMEKNILQEQESMNILKELGFTVNESFEINSKEDLEDIKSKIKYPAVLKTAEEGILHKADVGGVILNIKDYGELENSYIAISTRLGNKAIVTQMRKFDTELIFGMKTDPTFGPIIIIGAGGIYTELLRDRIVLLPETSRVKIREKLKALKTYKLLRGYRGAKAVDVDMLINEIEKFQDIVKCLSPWVEEIDINPVALDGENIVALDALIVNKK